MNNHDYDEQRHFTRMAIKTQVTYTIKNTDGISHQGISGDLSASGLYMITDIALNKGDEISLVMNPSDDRFPPFVAEGIVLRTTVSEHNPDKFHVSMELTKTS